MLITLIDSVDHVHVQFCGAVTSREHRYWGTSAADFLSAFDAFLMAEYSSYILLSLVGHLKDFDVLIGLLAAELSASLAMLAGPLHNSLALKHW